MKPSGGFPPSTLKPIFSHYTYTQQYLKKYSKTQKKCSDGFGNKSRTSMPVFKLLNVVKYCLQLDYLASWVLKGYG